MVGRALSERVKRQQCRRVANATMQKAVDEYHCEQAKPDGMRKLGYRPIADKYGISSTTLHSLVNGRPSMSAFNASKRKLTYAEERVLVDFILESSDQAIPLSLSNIAVHANGILGGRKEPVEPVGESWVPRFLDRYRDELQTHWSRPLATERARSLNKDAVKHWFELIKKKIIDKGIKEYNIYGMDESGFPPANQGVQRVVGRRGTKVQHKAGSANRETVLVTICADGTALQPTIIFKGKQLLKKWGDNNVSNASSVNIVSSIENGLTENLQPCSHGKRMDRWWSCSGLDDERL